ncbi:hypothetical protein HOF65_03200 [bacterium]|jgi:hypothetical protein|nr:hypothetical protein [bacterium]MBT3852998.1 hypothetical protein [bacterium]MBT4632624.1 hypothetical protein [bacterium]MBT5491512.1 hypothetical protein [bacterium]MBT6778990.1 hypothetical protein [bacterium]
MKYINNHTILKYIRELCHFDAFQNKDVKVWSEKIVDNIIILSITNNNLGILIFLFFNNESIKKSINMLEEKILKNITFVNS